ncbi:MAG: hypothetical protein WKG06_40600 [Segetibacter sp.]
MNSLAEVVIVLTRSLFLFLNTSGLGSTFATGGRGTLTVSSFLGSVTIAGGGTVFSLFL